MNITKSKKTKKLSTTLVLFSVIILLILNLISAVFIGSLTKQSMDAKEDAFLQQTNTNAKNQVEDYVEKYSTIAETLAMGGDIQKTFAASTADSPLSASPQLQSIVQSFHEMMQENPEILGVGFASTSENRMYDQDGVHYDVLLSERPYFSAASQGTTVTQPYTDTASGELCVSIATPVKSNGSLVGMIILDLKLDSLSDFLAELSFGQTGRIALISQDDTVIGFVEKADVGKNVTEIGMTSEILAEMKSHNGEIMSYVINGSNRMGTVIELSDYGWKLFAGMSSAEYNQATLRTVFFLLVVLLLSTVIVSVCLSAMIVKRLHPIQDIVDAAEKISRGDLDIQLDIRSEDEIGNLERIFLSMSATLKSIIDDMTYLLDELSTGNFRITTNIRERYVGDYRHILLGLTKIRNTLSDTLRNVSVSIGQVASEAHQVATGAQSLAQGSTEQASSVQGLSANAQDISGKVSHNAERAETAHQQILKAQEDLGQSGQKMQELVTAMGQIKATSNEIQGIIKTIDDIAFQTNILALNAAVEAARAGSAGKGFAVVADEVRNLATKSAEASKSTQRLIQAAIEAVENGSGLAEETSMVLRQTADDTSLIMASITDIAEASVEQASALSQITHELDQISNVVHTNSATSEESAAASEELSSQAQILKNLISQFRLPDTTDGTPQS